MIRGAVQVAMVVAIAVLVLLLGLPLLALLVRVPSGSLLSRLSDPVIQEALRLSLFTSLVSTLIVVLLGTPVAYLLATRTFPGKPILETVIDLPMVLPPTVAGLALLLAFGRAGLAGRALSALGITIPFTTAAVVVAQVFMSVPFFLTSARAGFAGVPRSLTDAAATLRASESYAFFRVVLPLSMPALVAGASMSCARALGEFGATITFAGNLPGITQTMPLAVYVAFQTDLEASIVLSVILMLLSFLLLVGLRATPAGLAGRRPTAPRLVSTISR
ncbi:MAG TPA: ABC transporter permease [Candidatus Eisenbacteria bacterium]|nr:ABC transporter permease [Candidatus Eisenbacteria bacterium]